MGLAARFSRTARGRRQCLFPESRACRRDRRSSTKNTSSFQIDSQSTGLCPHDASCAIGAGGRVVDAGLAPATTRKEDGSPSRRPACASLGRRGRPPQGRALRAAAVPTGPGVRPCPGRRDPGGPAAAPFARIEGEPAMARINELYERIAHQIVAQMAEGVLPWHRPWAVNPNARVSRSRSARTRVPYQGINVLILWSAAIDKGYASSFWMTYRQAAVHRRPGAQGRARHAHRLRQDREEEGRPTSSATRPRCSCRCAASTRCSTPTRSTGCPTSTSRRSPTSIRRARRRLPGVDRLARHRDPLRRPARLLRARSGPRPDAAVRDLRVRRRRFHSTLLHELTHSTGHKDRLDRLTRPDRRQGAGARGAGRGTGLGVPLRRSRHRLLAEGRPRELHRLLVGAPHRRAAGGVRRGDPGAAGGRVPARAARAQHGAPLRMPKPRREPRISDYADGYRRPCACRRFLRA